MFNGLCKLIKARFYAMPPESLTFWGIAIKKLRVLMQTSKVFPVLLIRNVKRQHVVPGLFYCL